VKIGLCCELLGSMHLPSDQVTDMELCKSLSQDLLFWLAGWLAGWWLALQTKSTKIISNLIWICLVQAMLSFQMQSTTHVLAELRFGVLYWFIFHVQGWFILLYNLIMRHPLLDVLVLFFFFFLFWMSGPAYVHLD
jgi:hypothetical protein